jgi:hypothetical protein
MRVLLLFAVLAIACGSPSPEERAKAHIEARCNLVAHQECKEQLRRCGFTVNASDPERKACRPYKERSG